MNEWTNGRMNNDGWVQVVDGTKKVKMRNSNLQSRDFNVPLECNERNEMWRYVSSQKEKQQQSSSDEEIISRTTTTTTATTTTTTTGTTKITEHRPRSEPPAKFSFLSGIHPDLDEALCELQSPTNVDRRSDQSRRRTNDRLSSGKISSTSFLDERTNMNMNTNIHVVKDKSSKKDRDRDRDHRSVFKRNGDAHDDKSKENFIQVEFEPQGGGYNTRQRQMASTSVGGYDSPALELGYFEAKTGENVDLNSVPSVMESVSSKPKEITCTKGLNLNESIDSLPFSLDGMERAKRRIKSQAAKIRDLEAKLEKASSSVKINSADLENKQAGLKKVMSPEERLRAHMERKRLENKYKEEAGKWDAPPPLKQENLPSKVKRKDKLVDRLVADPKERKRQDEVRRKVKRAINEFAKATSDDELNDDEDYSMTRRSSNEKVSTRSKTKAKKNRRAAGTMPESLMKRLNMNVEERRGLKKNKDELPDNLKRTLRGHKMQKKSWRMSREFEGARAEVDDDSSEGGEWSEASTSHGTKNKIQCETCMSTSNCEEDVDNPGTYYCKQCWEDYENNNQEEESLYTGDSTYSDVESFRSEGEYSPMELRSKKKTHYDDALWIIHDNPKLGGRLTWSGSRKMSCLVETKDPGKKNCVRILRGMIEYCGKILESGIGNDSVHETDRGAECIRLSNIDGFIVDHDRVDTRLAKNKSIYEFRLDQDEAIQVTGKGAQMRLKDFFNDCVGAVDVILAPQCSPGGWYPQREAASNSRKLAPQFRSNGLGYIRLGDDMGNNGLAFLSSDSCKTFFSNEPVERQEINEDLLKTASSFVSKRPLKPSSRSSNQRQGHSMRKRSSAMNKRISQNIPNRISDTDSDDESSSVSSDDDDDECSKDAPNAGALLKELQNFEVSKEVKWKEKADLLVSLGKAIGKPNGRAACSNSLSYIQDIISAKNVNINVLRSALLVVEKIGSTMKQELTYHIAWKTVLIEILKLLKNKQVRSGAKEILRKLHGQCFTLGNSMVAISHVLGMGKSTNQRKSLSASSKQTPANKSNQSMQKSNNVEIIEWLAVTTEAERGMEDISPMVDENGLSQLATIFLSHQSHRDANCRKNALDGLLHTVLYGIEGLEMTKTEALNLCSELKTSNPRSWARLTKGVNLVLKERTRRKR